MQKFTTSVARGGLARSAAYLAVVASIAFGLTACGDSDSAAARPNILLIVADDLGYSDLGAFGSEISTPNLDTLAAEGRLLLNHHTSTSCAPTRATLQAGTDQHLTGIGSQSIASYQRGKPGYEGYLNERSLYMAEVLRDGGYHTYIAGKWHLGNEENQAPPARGYEKSYVLLPGVANHFGSRADNPLPNNNGPYRENGATVTPPAEFFSTEFYTDKLIDYIGITHFDLGRGLSDTGGIGNVQLQCFGRQPFALQIQRNVVTLGEIACADQHVYAFASELAGGFQADAARGAGDQCDAFTVAAHSSS